MEVGQLPGCDLAHTADLAVRKTLRSPDFVTKFLNMAKGHRQIQAEKASDFLARLVHNIQTGWIRTRTNGSSKKSKGNSMNKGISRTIRGMVVSLLVVLGAGPARALDVLSFDLNNPERNEVISALGFSITHAGSGALPGLDFSLFDFIYVAPSIDNASLQTFLGSRADDLNDFLTSGGSLVFGSPTPGGEKDLEFGLREPDTQELTANVVTAVPEPGTLALFGLGAAGLFFFRRRLKAKA